MSEAKERQQVASYKMQSALLEIKGYADRGEKIYPRIILMLWEQEGLAEAIDQAALTAPSQREALPAEEYEQGFYDWWKATEIIGNGPLKPVALAAWRAALTRAQGVRE